MSDSSYRVGEHAARKLIDKADETYARGGGWTTNDLGDFVAGMIDSCLAEYTRLYPERVQAQEIRIEYHS